MDYKGKQFGNYRAVHLITENGITQTYEGTHIALKKKVLIVVLTSSTFEQSKHFFAMMHPLARLLHPHIMKVLDIGESDHIPYIILEYAKDTLEIRHPKGTKLPLPTIISYVKPVAEALQYAHAQEIVHGDIKPANIFIGQNNEILLGGWELAIDDYEKGRMVEVIGTPMYMAPEQFRGEVRPTIDQYALGVTVYEWLTGSLPFKGDMVQLITQHVHTPPPPLRFKNPSIPQAVEDVVLKALAKNAEDRFESVIAFAEALERASQPPKPKFHPKDLLGQQFGNYRLTTLLGIGSFGDVYIGEHVTLGSKAAIKVFREYMDVDQFRNAVRRLARLQHPNIVRVLDSGIQNERPFLVLDYVAKGSLYQHHTQSGQARLALPIVINYVQQLAIALQEIHDYNIVPSVVNVPRK